MRTNVASFILSSENRKEVVKTIFDYPRRQWTCSSLEEFTKIPHATVFRTLKGLGYFGVLKKSKINRKDILYELVDSPIVDELKRIINLEKITIRSITNEFINKIKSKNIYSAILYGSSISGRLKPESDIDILIILDKRQAIKEKEITDIAAYISSRTNKTISPVIMDKKELFREKYSQFIKSVKANMEVLYGKKPF